MKTLLTLLTVCFSFTVSAGYHMGGYITANQLNGRLYKITMVILAEINSPADYSTAIIKFGDNKTETASRTSLSTEDGIQRNVYTTEHLYATEGIYTISYTYSHFPANIVNLNGGFSDNTPFQTSCLIKVSNTLSGVQSAIPLAFEFVKGVIDKTTHYNPTFVGGDGNSVVHELVADYPSLTNYRLPDESSINPFSGMITFTTKYPGLFLFMIRVSSYQNGVLIAQSDIVQMSRIIDGVGGPPFVDVPLASLSSQGWYSRELVPNQTIDQRLQFSEISGSFSAEVYSELTDKGAIITSLKPTSDSLILNLNWTALPNYARNTPYFITYRFRRTTQNIIDDYNIAFYHGAPINTGIHEPASTDEYIIVYPNPAYGATQCFFVFKDIHQAQLSIYDALGRMMTTQTINGKSITIETSAWKSGMYTYTLLMENGEVQNGKLVIE